MATTANDGSGGYPMARRAILGWCGTVLGVAAIGIGGWAHERLWNNEQEITRLKALRDGDQMLRAADKENAEKLEHKIDALLIKQDDLRDLVIRLSARTATP